MSSKNTNANYLPNSVMLGIFLLLAAILWFLGDTFTFIVGLLVLIGVFAAGYNNNPINHEHH